MKNTVITKVIGLACAGIMAVAAMPVAASAYSYECYTSAGYCTTYETTGSIYQISKNSLKVSDGYTVEKFNITCGTVILGNVDNNTDVTVTWKYVDGEATATVIEASDYCSQEYCYGIVKSINSSEFVVYDFNSEKDVKLTITAGSKIDRDFYEGDVVDIIAVRSGNSLRVSFMTTDDKIQTTVFGNVTGICSGSISILKADGTHFTVDTAAAVYHSAVSVGSNVQIDYVTVNGSAEAVNVYTY